MWLRVAGASARLQLRLVGRNAETIRALFTMPLATIVSMAIFVESGRTDLAGYALCASFLMTIGQMALVHSSEISTNDRANQRLELMLAAPAPYYLGLGVRTLILTSFGLVGFLESWLIARLVFGVSIEIFHPWALAATLIATAVSAGATALLVSAIFTPQTSIRTAQNAVNGPFYLLGGVMVPTRFLPIWLQPISPFIFFYWAANLVRDCLKPAPLHDLYLRLGALVGLGVVAGVIGIFVMNKMLDQLRRTGQVSLA
jgi:ABC-2 type transport system permease protein